MTRMFDPYRRLVITYLETPTNENEAMPRSKFATKAYGPTKPKICEKQQLPEGTLPPGPGLHNTAHFLLNVSGTGPDDRLVTGSVILTRSDPPNTYRGRVSCAQFSIALVLTVVGPILWPEVHFEIFRGTTFINSGVIFKLEPYSIDPYDTGVMPYGPRGPFGQQMIRVVARD